MSDFGLNVCSKIYKCQNNNGRGCICYLDYVTWTKDNPTLDFTTWKELAKIEYEELK